MTTFCRRDLPERVPADRGHARRRHRDRHQLRRRGRGAGQADACGGDHRRRVGVDEGASPKLSAAIAATMAAIDCLPDGTLFGVIAGASDARRVYPSGNELATASTVTRGDAKLQVSRSHAAAGRRSAGG